MGSVVPLHPFEIGVVGLDSGARKLARALSREWRRVTTFDRNPENIRSALDASQGSSLHVAKSMADFLKSLRPPRIVALCESAPASDPFFDLIGNLQSGDLLIDASNCHFKDCGRRARQLAERNVRHLGMGINCGGEGEGALVLMVGGRPDIYRGIRSLLEAAALKADGEACVSHLGPAVSGHFVKMIHDGIEFALVRIVGETLELMKRTLALDEQDVRPLSRAWKIGPFESPLHDHHGRSLSQAGRELGIPTPIIDAALGIRTLSELEKQNDFRTSPFRQPLGHFGDDRESILTELHDALHAAMMITYAEGLGVLSAASERHGFDIDLLEVIRLWKGCCSQRGAFLNEIAAAIRLTPGLPNLLYDDDLSEKIMRQQERLRHAVWRAGVLQSPAPALMAALDYLDCYRGAWLPVNLIQVPRTRWSPPSPFVVRGDLPADWNHR